MASVTSSRPFHLIIFGASGFTGQFVVQEVARCAAESPGGSPLKWAVAGRSRQRLEEVLKHAAERLSMPELTTDIDIIVADVSIEESLSIMCQQGLVILNCVGPYRFYGEPVVKACVENGAHYIDICGEPQFLERMQLEYHTKALDRGVYVIGSCGFDSIPADLGILYTNRQFRGTLTAVESFLNISSGPKGASGHDATWQSAVYGFADSRSLRQLRKKFGHKPLPVVGAKVHKRGFVFFSKEIEQYVIPFMGSDPSVVKRTQRFLYEEEHHSPVQYSAYVGVGGIFSLVKLFCGGLLFWFMVKFSLGRRLLTTVTTSVTHHRHYVTSTFFAVFMFCSITHSGELVITSVRNNVSVSVNKMVDHEQSPAKGGIRIQECYGKGTPLVLTKVGCLDDVLRVRPLCQGDLKMSVGRVQ
uniref:Saccharopine dehydrogenase-like oxidoreductase n=1 Tax=Sphaeramia orbicularis TaxID=375764 RepID=A0A672YD72_9TELE